MKHTNIFGFLIITTILLLIPAVSTAKSSKKGDAAITFNEETFDFGVIRENGGLVSHTFEFTNTGDAPLMIINASASCGCTRPTFPKKPIQPGKTDKIKVTFNPKGRPGESTKTITVRTNSKRQKKVTLKIKMFVEP